jgi:hypothetical protein
MSLYKAEQHRFRAINELIHQQPFDCAYTVKKCLELPGSVQQMIITHLIYLYSFFISEDDWRACRERYKDDVRTGRGHNIPRNEAAARKAMFNLRQVVHALAHNDGPQPRAGHYFKAKLSVWQEHLLKHFELLAPFPEDVETEEEAFDFMWGTTWRTDFNLQLDCNFLKLAPTAGFAWEFGYSLPQLARSSRNLADSQDDSEPITPLTIIELSKEFEYVKDSIYRRCNFPKRKLIRPRTVTIGKHHFPSPSRNRFPGFLANPVLPAVAVAERFPLSRYDFTRENYLKTFTELTPLDNSTEGEQVIRVCRLKLTRRGDSSFLGLLDDDESDEEEDDKYGPSRRIAKRSEALSEQGTYFTTLVPSND